MSNESQVNLLVTAFLMAVHLAIGCSAEHSDGELEVRKAKAAAIEQGTAQPTVSAYAMSTTEPRYSSAPGWSVGPVENPFATLAQYDGDPLSWNEEFRELKNAEFGYSKRNRYPELRSLSANQDEYVLVDDRQIIYRRMQFRFESTFIFFHAGTANPVAYSGRLGRCLLDRVREDDGPCSFSQDDRLYIDGFAWPAEGPKTTPLRELSQKRVHLLKTHLSNTDLPTKGITSKAHGATRTRARIDAGAPLIGLSFIVISKFRGTPAEPLKFRECKTTQWNPLLMKRLQRFIASNRVEPIIKCRGCGWHTVLYRNDAGEIEEYGPHGVLSRIRWPRTAVMVWAHQLRKHECNLDKSPLPHRIHPDHPSAIPFARHLPELAKNALLPLIF